MKSSRHYLPLALISSVALLTACGGSDGGGTAAYPTGIDSYEGSTGDNTPATASRISVGQSQSRTLWPMGDQDYVKVNLSAGTEYEFSANRLCATCDTYLYLYDIDGVTILDTDDDYIGYDSMIRYTPVADGTYYLRVEAYDETYGVATYTLGARTVTDNDGDGYSTYYDCNDGDATIYPGATEVVEDGISQNCSGTDRLAATTADPFEPDDTAETARPMFMTDIYAWEIQYQQTGWAQNKRTIHAAEDKDYFSITLGPKEAAYITSYQSPSIQLLMTVYDSDGTTVLYTYSGSYPSYSLENLTDASKTFYVSYEASDGTSTTWYVPALYSVGTDNDDDEYHSRDWDSSRDCNDGNANIHPGATETAADGIDSNCNGDDNT